MKLISRYAPYTMGASAVGVLMVALLTPLLFKVSPVHGTGDVIANLILLDAVYLTMLIIFWAFLGLIIPIDDSVLDDKAVTMCAIAPLILTGAIAIGAGVRYIGENLPHWFSGMAIPLWVLVFSLLGILGGIGGWAYCLKRGC